MGIRGLTAALKPFASRSELRGRVVIDGPGLAYHILTVARAQAGVSTVLDEPTYAVLGQTAAWWLDELQSCGVTIAAIYFDGYLPSYKAQERLRRTCGSSSRSNQYFLATSAGVPGRAAAAASARPSLPLPPFVVPAVLECLRSLERYQRITHLVPGEADPYCASDVRQHGGTLLTGDSDFLLYELGPTGSVVFFQDVQAELSGVGGGGETKRNPCISALTYSPMEICGRLTMEPAGQGGMLALAYEMSLAQDRTLQALISKPRSQWACQATCQASQYAEFTSQYLLSKASLIPIPVYLGLLDPRVSEFVLDWAALAGHEPSSLVVTLARRPIVYLPSLLDRWDRASAWNAFTPIRQLAYSLCRVAGQSTVSTVTEYRRTLSEKSTGQQVQLLGFSEVMGSLRDTHNYILGFFKAPAVAAAASADKEARRLQWIATCMGFEISHAAAEGNESTALKLLQKAEACGGRLDPGNWDTLHLAAMIQGAMYSLRILQQVLMCKVGSVFASLDLEEQRHLREMEACLASLPCIAEFPAPVDMESLFQQLYQVGALKMLAKVVGISEPAFEQRPVMTKEGRRKGESKNKPVVQRQSKLSRSASSNLFDALSIDD
ncbi:hypothetical protein M406DRAFT_69621 [Cryphonectria parasitica EP155]|uniref:Asteroid domain-containing protein n=1 Tax=Cryphonectria parasitica (strain ATCC 38755 / EP155) TaxID=660469 RepID=A0A9P5CRF3_CRYP1|nr:uncharacterized protein M406DRAFT_69621 [Cryphonectria parasitica EP155]KAF3767477.1 hypothetical protein M406DRAFT_69621 [Cryphonectria parasitica EP155]